MDKITQTRTLTLLNEKLDLSPLALPEKYQVLRPLKALGLIRFEAEKYAAPQLASIACMTTRIAGFVRMFSLVVRPDYGSYLPVLSAEVIAMGKRRILFFEIINTTPGPDDNMKRHYAKLNAVKQDAPGLMEVTSVGWYQQMLAECSFKLRSQRQHDDRLLSLYLECVSLYLEMAAQAEPTDASGNRLLKQSAESFVEQLLSRGGPAVNVFRHLLGEAGQQEYVRTVMFGIQ